MTVVGGQGALVLSNEVRFNEVAIVEPEFLYLPAGYGLENALSWSSQNEQEGLQQIGTTTLSLLGVDGVLHSFGTRPDDVVPKPHDKVSRRDPAVAEQFYHPDVPFEDYGGILLIGLEGKDADCVPATLAINNEAMVEHVIGLAAGGPLAERLDEVVVVRPQFDTTNRHMWMDLPRHSFVRLLEKYRDLLSPEQVAHMERDVVNVTDRSRYTGPVALSRLVTQSFIDDSPLVTCGVAQRELRLALDGEETDEETKALAELHDDITRYLLNPDVPAKAVSVVEGSAIFVPMDQLHRATPYDSFKHRRSVVGIRCYTRPGYVAPKPWVAAEGTDY